MRIDSKGSIADVPVLRIRDFLRSLGEGWATADYFAERLGVTRKAALAVISELLKRGWVQQDGQRDGEITYRLADAGLQFTAAKAMKPMDRPTIEKLLAEFLQRVEIVNDDDDLTHAVAEVHVFGSYLDPDAVDFADLDLVVVLKSRDVPGRDFAEYCLRRAEASGKTLRTYIEQLFYGEKEVRQILKAKKGRISMHHKSEIENLGTPMKQVNPRST